MTVVGIDPSLTGTGLVIHRPGHTPDIYTIGSPTAATWPERQHRLETLRNRVMNAIPRNTTLAVMEGPSYGSSGSGTWDRAWYWGKLHDAFTALKIPLAICPPKTRAKWVCDDGNADKPTVRAAIQKMWPDAPITNYDEADAMCFAAIANQHLRRPVPYLVLERHHLALSKIDWPQHATTGDTLVTVPGDAGHQNRMTEATR